jgi:hypothetical protein
MFTRGRDRPERERRVLEDDAAAAGPMIQPICHDCDDKAR